jgi:hypothetical protein
MNFFLDVFSLDQMNDETFQSMLMLRELEQDRSGPDEGDAEATTELMLYLPEESEHEEGSPINYRGSFAPENHRLDSEAFIDSQIQEAYRQGV